MIVFGLLHGINPSHGWIIAVLYSKKKSDSVFIKRFTGENQTITFYSPTEGTYNYYDRLSSSNKPIGQIKAVKVTSFE